MKFRGAGREPAPGGGTEINGNKCEALGVGGPPNEFCHPATHSCLHHPVGHVIVPIAEIAPECGYHDPCGLSRTFARVMGCSPRRYRQNHRPAMVGTTVAADGSA